MKILVTNDDGVSSPGLIELLKELSKISSVTAVAPNRERSAVGHAVTFFHPLRMEKVKEEQNCTLYTTDGTPTDCILLGLSQVMKSKPDLIVTGINRGPNIGDDITYSGTVTSAMEGALRGIPSMAVSIAAFAEPLFNTAAVIAARLAPVILKKELLPRTLLNVNVPNLSLDKIAGVEITSQGESSYVQNFIKRKDPRGKEYYWFKHTPPEGNNQQGTDFHALSRNYVSITPLQLDLTCSRSKHKMKDWKVEKTLQDLWQ